MPEKIKLQSSGEGSTLLTRLRQYSGQKPPSFDAGEITWAKELGKLCYRRLGLHLKLAISPCRPKGLHRGCKMRHDPKNEEAWAIGGEGGGDSNPWYGYPHNGFRVLKFLCWLVLRSS